MHTTFNLQRILEELGLPRPEIHWHIISTPYKTKTNNLLNGNRQQNFSQNVCRFPCACLSIPVNKNSQSLSVTHQQTLP